MTKIAVVTGGTSGIGLEAARYLASQGCKVYTISRRESNEPGLHHLRADLTRPEDVARVVGQIIDTDGRIDLLLNNAGFGISGASNSQIWLTPSGSWKSISGVWSP